MVRPEAVKVACDTSSAPDTDMGELGVASMVTLRVSPLASAIWEARVRIQMSS